jgi:formylmethanofuran dehydrogenase subunit C
MKNRFWKLFVLVLLGAPALSRAQSYSIDWHAVDGGGGTSSAGQFTVAGTVGQCDEVQMTGGNFSIDDGSWVAFTAVQTLGAPMLRMQLSATNTIVIAWPANSTGFTLQQNSNLATTNWVNVSDAPNLVGSENQVVIIPTAGNNFYRLIQQ